MHTSFDLKAHFLIAMPQIADAYFANSVVFIAEHNARGTLGFMINRSSNLTLSRFFSEFSIQNAAPKIAESLAHIGGPVEPERGFLLHRPQQNKAFKLSLKVNDSLAITSSRDALEALATKTVITDFMLMQGYTGWRSGQIEDEIKQNLWLVLKADQTFISELIFKLPIEERFNAALEKLGISTLNFSGQSGNA